VNKEDDGHKNESQEGTICNSEGDMKETTPMDLSIESEWSAEQMSNLPDGESPEERRASDWHERNMDYFSFMYWREPVCELELEDLESLEDRDIIKTTTESNSIESSQASIESIQTELSILDSESSTEELSSLINSQSLEPEKESELKIPGEKNDINITDVLEVEEEETDKVLIQAIEVFNDNLSEQILESEHDSEMEMNKTNKINGTSSEVEEEISAEVKAEAAEVFKHFLTEQNKQDQYEDLALPQGPPQTTQSIVPQLLIDHYVSMIDPSRAQTVDSDIARHCAFSLPAVALTLGSANWPLLKETYVTLANDMQWKVRRTVASSIHDLGVILGENIAAEDLVPIFDGFIKDLDEVRIGALKHLSSFLALLSTESRNEYLPRLGEFLKMDNERNWRFRLELTEQIGLMLHLFSAEDIRDHLGPIAFQLVQDKVAAVRKAAAVVVSTMLSTLFKTEKEKYDARLASNIVKVLGQSTHWSRRQTFAVLCGEIVKNNQKEASYSESKFGTELLPQLLDLTWDKVPNVRIAVARVLMQLGPEHYSNCKDLIDAAMAQLKQDKDVNVREETGENISNLTQLH